MSPTVHIVLAVFNGERYLPQFLDSLQRQTHPDWALWVRDDGSTDGGAALVRARAAADHRICLAEDAANIGSTASFGWLLEHLPPDARYIMCADHDDVWLPRKIERTLEAMHVAEEASAPGTPIVVHTDARVVGADLRVVHQSLFEYMQMPAEPSTLRRIAVQNVVTGALMMLNRPLLDRALDIPADAAQHDWWLASVAAAFGRIVFVPEATMLYRQHGANETGARDRRVTIARLPGAILRGMRSTAAFRSGLVRSARQARALVERYSDDLSPADRDFLDAFSAIPHHGFVQRRMDMLRLRQYPGGGVLRTLGVVVRG